MSLRVRIAGVAAGVAVLIGATAGITYAATAASVPSNDYANACSNSAHTATPGRRRGRLPDGLLQHQSGIGPDRPDHERVKFNAPVQEGKHR